MLLRALLSSLPLVPLALAALYVTALWRPPPAWDPLAPLDFRDTPTLVTHWKLSRMAWQPETCLAAFAASGLKVTPLPDRPSEAGCPLENTVRLAGEGASLAPAGPVATCPLAAAWEMFERYALQPAAERHFGSRVARVQHLGTFACRNVYGRTEGRRSEHATANAIDVAGFTLANGRELRLPRDWGEGEAGAFLREVRDGACRFFRAVLGPDHNAAHRDHFHLDRGPWPRCS
ncbi:extensin family protein [Roseomonas sp. M0104]|uniref:Extensin family protein n=1 Tax=Teichococcus coralli TaxID=2545983 RepID=A0A845BI69_9PROT|nr:extensin family protein [Pseudoroseomonas coralli]MXP65764.1 extensin family protein [Pseudoroseomonas coralli]